MNNSNITNEVTPLISSLPPSISTTTTTTTTYNGNVETITQSSSPSSPPSSSTGSSYWKNYMIAIEKYPIRTKSITAFIIFVTADTMAQIVEYYLLLLSSFDSKSVIICNIDWIRTLRFGAIGFFGAPWSHYYFYWLDHYLPPSVEPFTIRTFIKVIIDQFIQAPILLAIVIFSLALMKGQGWIGAKHDLSNTFVMLLIANWKLWIPASIINIAFIQPSLRVLYVNVVFFFWTIILSLMLNQSTSE